MKDIELHQNTKTKRDTSMNNDGPPGAVMYLPISQGPKDIS